MRLVLTLSIVLVFAGCSLFKPTKLVLPKGDTQELNVKKVDLKPKEQTKPQPKVQERKEILSQMVRGVIYAQKFDNATRNWVYTLSVKDIASDYLDTKTFSYHKRLYNVGDLVYAVFHKNNLRKLKNLYLIKKNYENIDHTSSHVEQKAFRNKRTKSRKTPWISVPKSETVILK